MEVADQTSAYCGTEGKIICGIKNTPVHNPHYANLLLLDGATSAPDWDLCLRSSERVQAQRLFQNV